MHPNPGWLVEGDHTMEGGIVAMDRSSRHKMDAYRCHVL